MKYGYLKDGSAYAIKTENYVSSVYVGDAKDYTSYQVEFIGTFKECLHWIYLNK